MGFTWVYGAYTQAQTYSDTIQGVWVAGIGIRYARMGGHILAGVGVYMIMGANFLGAYTCCRNGPGHLTHTHPYHRVSNQAQLGTICPLANFIFLEKTLPEIYQLEIK